MKRSYGNQSDLNLKLVIGIHRTYADLRRKESQNLRDAGLTLAQFGVLEALYHLGDMTVGDLIEKTLSTSGNMTVVVKNLERDGLVSRSRYPEDRRSFVVQLTDQGQALIHTVFASHLAFLNENFEHMALEEKQTLLALLKKASRT